MDYVEYACNKLRANGYRITSPRTRILSLLEAEDRSLSPYDIRDRLLKKQFRLDVVTVYRVLVVLERLGLAHRIYSTGGYVRCRRRDLRHHHHHLVCTGCGNILEITGDQVDEVVNRVEGESGYRVAGHIPELIGLCRSCQV